MTMNRGIIRMTEGGKVRMPLIDVWMTKEEIADMFGLPEASIIRAICSIYKKSELYEHRRCGEYCSQGMSIMGATSATFDSFPMKVTLTRTETLSKNSSILLLRCWYVPTD